MRYIYIVFLGIFFFSSSLAQEKDHSLLKKIEIAFRKNKLDKAERYIDKLLATEEYNAKGYYWRAKLKMKDQEVEAAFQNLEYAMNLDEENTFYWMERAAYKRSLGFSSINSPEHCDCGKSYIVLGPEEKLDASAYFRSAIRDLEKVLLIDPKEGKAAYEIGSLYILLGKKEQACQAFSLAQKLAYKEAEDAYKKHCIVED